MYQNSLGEILFENPPNLKRMYKFINVLPPSLQFMIIAAIFFVTDYEVINDVMMNPLICGTHCCSNYYSVVLYLL